MEKSCILSTNMFNIKSLITIGNKIGLRIDREQLRSLTLVPSHKPTDLFESQAVQFQQSANRLGSQNVPQA